MKTKIAKIIALQIAAVMALGLFAGCGQNDDGTTPTTTANNGSAGRKQ